MASCSMTSTDATVFQAGGHWSSSKVTLPLFYSADEADIKVVVDSAKQTSLKNPLPEGEKLKPVVVRQAPPCPDLPAAGDYLLHSRPKGMVLIVNVTEILEHPIRTGANEDERNLKDLFRKMGFRVECCRDFSLAEMDRKIQGLRRRPELSLVDSLFLVVMSHGEGRLCEETRIVFKDGLTQECGALVRMFHGDACGALLDKPKVFLFQLCRGAEVNRLPAAMKLSRTDRDGTVAYVGGRSVEDIFVANATAQGFPAYRDKDHGSWFVQLICKIYSQFGRDCCLETLHKKIDDKLKVCLSDDNYHGGQTSSYTSQGFKRFYFYPGNYN